MPHALRRDEFFFDADDEVGVGGIPKNISNVIKLVLINNKVSRHKLNSLNEIRDGVWNWHKQCKSSNKSFPFYYYYYYFLKTSFNIVYLYLIVLLQKYDDVKSAVLRNIKHKK